MNALAASGPGCSRDDECVVLNTSLHCVGLSLGSCGTVVHRSALSSWDERAVCAEIEQLPADDGLACEIATSCLGPKPACLRGRCSSR
jgi:hypothetical protein